jgi:hypothetical protein
MSKLLATLFVSIVALALGGCADSAKEPRQGPGMDKGSKHPSPNSGSSGQDAEHFTVLENCVTAVGAARKNCTAK